MAWNRAGIQCSIFISPNDVDPNTGYFEGVPYENWYWKKPESHKHQHK